MRWAGGWRAESVWATTPEGIFSRVLSLLTLPPRLLIRALDDLHALAEAARTLPEIERRTLERIAEIQALLERGMEVGRRIDERGAGLMALGERIDARASEVLAMAETLEAAAASVAAQGAAVAAALPSLEQAVHMMDEMNRSAEAMAAVAEPLHGAAERLGRIVDRLPGAKPRG